MNRDRIAELLSPFLRAPIPGSLASAQLSSAQLDRISTYIDILVRWNARINLTAIRDHEEIVTRHFGESLFTARFLFPPNAPAGATAKLTSKQASTRSSGAPHAPAVADLGSGAGFPGLPIKLWAPHVSLTLVESNQKKATFLREITRALTLTDVNIQNVRAETLARSQFQVISLRAVERFESILPTAASLLAPSGRLALLIGVSQAIQARRILPNLTWLDPIPIPNSTSRILLSAV
ncbi:MAG TPA: 16S rRNA (guanine(527)-N(7))-methyltransferase RsmG [Candidatus Sulfotelmatobacter sp.]|nr:16S rRNA (guanine(527)-N(7))-methyltransferase RsmG [Candidatus Sulfotelmatobacter sp.]